MLLDTLSMTYLWLKAGHIIFVIFWMAGLFMLPRYFVYHQEAELGSPEDERWTDRERKLLKIILLPSIIVVWVLGLMLAMTTGAFSQGWFHAKLLLVILLTGYHGYMVAQAKRMLTGDRPLSEKRLKLFGEIPAILLAIIVVLVIVKPF